MLVLRLLHCPDSQTDSFSSFFVESFWSSLKYEVVYRQRFATFGRGSYRHL